MPRMRSRSTACSTCSRTSIGPSLRRRTRTITTRSRRPARRSVRSMTTGFCSAVSRWRWSWRRSSRSRDLRLRWSASNMSARRMSPTSKRNASAPGSRSRRRRTRGNAAEAFEQAAVQVKAEYRMPVEHHNPMETFAATAVWEGDGRITVFDKTQGPQNCRNYVAERVRDAARQGARAVALCRRRIRIRACVRNISCRSPCWRRARSSARCG